MANVLAHSNYQAQRKRVPEIDYSARRVLLALFQQATTRIKNKYLTLSIGALNASKQFENLYRVTVSKERSFRSYEELLRYLLGDLKRALPVGTKLSLALSKNGGPAKSLAITYDKIAPSETEHTFVLSNYFTESCNVLIEFGPAPTPANSNDWEIVLEKFGKKDYKFMVQQKVIVIDDDEEAGDSIDNALSSDSDEDQKKKKNKKKKHKKSGGKKSENESEDESEDNDTEDTDSDEHTQVSKKNHSQT